MNCKKMLIQKAKVVGGHDVMTSKVEVSSLFASRMLENAGIAAAVVAWGMRMGAYIVDGCIIFIIYL